jgi:hypothetical protein
MEPLKAGGPGMDDHFLQMTLIELLVAANHSRPDQLHAAYCMQNIRGNPQAVKKKRGAL